MAKLSDLQTKYKALDDQAAGILEARDKSGQEFTPEQKTGYMALIAEKNALKDDIQLEITAENERKSRALDQANAKIVTPEAKAAKDFSWNRAINQIIGHKNLDGLEGEMNQEAEREMKAAGIVKSGNVAIPAFLMGFKGVTKDGVRNSDIMGQQRDLTAAGSSTGDELVEDLTKGHIFALNIAPKVISTLGATVLPGLTSDVHFTKSGTATSVWATENAASTETTPSTARITMTPKRLTGYTEISKTLLVQAPGIVNAIVARELETSTNVALDAAAYSGSGAAGQPTGLLLMASGINVNSATTIDREALINMEQLIAEDNADIDMMKFVTTPGLRAMLKNQRTDAGSAPPAP